LFEDGRDGILYEGWQGDSCLNAVSDRLYKGIDKMWTEQEKIENYCQNARLHARKTHDSEENYRKLMEIYAEVEE